MLKKYQNIDLIIGGSGPSALALAAASAERGLKVVVVAPQPQARWKPNYAAWIDELKGLGLEQCIERTWAAPIANFSSDSVSFKDTGRGHMTDPSAGIFDLNRRYAKISTPQLQSWLQVRALRNGVSFIEGKVISVEHEQESSTVTFFCTENLNSSDRALGTDPSEIRALNTRVFVDATGSSSPFVRRTSEDKPGWQVAYGELIEVDFHDWDSGELTLMDYRIPQGISEIEHQQFLTTPTFLYVLPLSPTTLFVEETQLVTRNRLSYEQLKQRLYARMRAMNIRPKSVVEREFCTIQMGGGVPLSSQKTLAFGAACGLVHPSTGYQVARVLALAPQFADALKEGLNIEPSKAIEYGWEVLWPSEQRSKWKMYQLGLEVFCSLSNPELCMFFRSFFSIPQHLWQGFLSDDASFSEISEAMLQIFYNADHQTKQRLVQQGIRYPVPLLQGAWSAVRPIFERSVV